MKNTWFKINAKEESDTVDVQILEEIGGWGVSGQAFMSELKSKAQGNKKINLLINSPGGSVIEGNFIYNELVKIENHITAEISGMAASMGSIIAMAADKVAIHENSYLMIHNPWTMAAGDSNDLRKMADLMDGMKDSAIKAYQRHTSLDADKISELMDEETWMDGLEAVALGFADTMLEPLDIAACAKEIPASVKAMVQAEALPQEEETEQEEEVKDAVDTPEDQPAECEDAEVIDTVDTDVDAEADPEVEEPEVTDTTGTDIGDVVDVVEPVIENKVADVELSKPYIDLLAKLDKQTELTQKMQSERDKARAELEKVQDDSKEQISNAVNLAADLRVRLAKVTSPGFSFTGEGAATTWRDAYDKLGYEEARKQHPELYREFMNRKKK